jgi:hypothetical protein
MKKVICLNRRSRQLHVWDDEELTAAYWGVIGLVKNDTGKRWRIKVKCGGEKHFIGSVTTDSYIKEEWK